METKEFFKKWKSDSPKSFQEFKNFMEENNFPYSYSDDIEFYYCGEYVLEFYLLTGAIEKFFEENGFILLLDIRNASEYGYYIWNIKYKCRISEHTVIAAYNNKEYTIKMGYLKLAQILEGHLNEN